MKEILLSKGKVAIVDDEDFDRISVHKWSFLSSGYAYRFERGKNYRTTGSEKCILMHRFILGIDDSREVDHINRNKLDNRRQNIRPCTSSQNKFNKEKPLSNRSGFKGVYPHTKGRWKASIKIMGVQKHLGIFTRKEDAARAFDIVAKKYHGEFAVLNLE